MRRTHHSNTVSGFSFAYSDRCSWFLCSGSRNFVLSGNFISLFCVWRMFKFECRCCFYFCFCVSLHPHVFPVLTSGCPRVDCTTPTRSARQESCKHAFDWARRFKSAACRQTLRGFTDLQSDLRRAVHAVRAMETAPRVILARSLLETASTSRPPWD